MAIATCCHHKCDSKTFVNPKLFLNLGGFTEQEMEILPRISSWAIMGIENFEKSEIGLKVKRLIDYARVQFMQEKLPNLTCGAF